MTPSPNPDAPERIIVCIERARFQNRTADHWLCDAQAATKLSPTDAVYVRRDVAEAPIRTALHIPGEAAPRLFPDPQAAIDWLLTTDYAHRPLVSLIRAGLRIETVRLREKESVG